MAEMAGEYDSAHKVNYLIDSNLRRKCHILACIHANLPQRLDGKQPVDRIAYYLSIFIHNFPFMTRHLRYQSAKLIIFIETA